MADDQAPLPELSPPQRRWRWRVLVATWCCYAGFYFCRKSLFAAKQTLINDYGFDTVDVGDVGLAYLSAYAVGQFTWAFLGPRLGPRRVLLGGMAVSIAANVASGFSPTYWVLVMFWTLNGLAQATGWACLVGSLNPWSRRRERGRIMAIWGTCYMVGSIAASSFAGLCIALGGLRFAFLAASGVLTLVWVLNYFWLRSSPAQAGVPPLPEDPLYDDDGQASASEPGSSDEAAAPNSEWTRPLMASVALLGACYFGIKFIRYAIWSWAPLLLEREFGLRVDNANYVSTAFDIGGIAGVFAAGFLSDMLFAGRRASVALLMLIGLVMATALLFTVGTTTLVLFVVSLFLIGFTLYGPDSLVSGACPMDLGSPAVALRAAGIINGVGAVGSVAQEPIMSRVIAVSGLGGVAVLLVVAALLAVGGLSLVTWRNRRGYSDV